MRWALIKAGLSRRPGKDERIRQSGVAKPERDSRNRRYWVHQTGDEAEAGREMGTKVQSCFGEKIHGANTIQFTVCY